MVLYHCHFHTTIPPIGGIILGISYGQLVANDIPFLIDISAISDKQWSPRCFKEYTHEYNA